MNRRTEDSGTIRVPEPDTVDAAKDVGGLTPIAPPLEVPASRAKSPIAPVP